MNAGFSHGGGVTNKNVRPSPESASPSIHLGNDSLLPLLSFYNVMLVRPSSLSPVMQIPFGRTGDRSLTRSPARSTRRGARVRCTHSPITPLRMTLPTVHPFQIGFKRRTRSPPRRPCPFKFLSLEITMRPIYHSLLRMSTVLICAAESYIKLRISTATTSHFDHRL